MLDSLSMLPGMLVWHWVGIAEVVANSHWQSQQSQWHAPAGQELPVPRPPLIGVGPFAFADLDLIQTSHVQITTALTGLPPVNFPPAVRQLRFNALFGHDVPQFAPNA